MYTVGESHTVSYNGMIQITRKYCQEVLQAAAQDLNCSTYWNLTNTQYSKTMGLFWVVYAFFLGFIVTRFALT